jgi:hypothetical protein
MVQAVKASFNPTSSAQIELFTLPAGAIPLGVQSLGGATGGTNPTVDIGSAGDDDGFANELDADTLTLVFGSGALTGIALAADTKVYGKVGASAATGGTTTIVFHYIMSDNHVHG